MDYFVRSAIPSHIGLALVLIKIPIVLGLLISLSAFHLWLIVLILINDVLIVYLINFKLWLFVKRTNRIMWLDCKCIVKLFVLLNLLPRHVLPLVFIDMGHTATWCRIIYQIIITVLLELHGCIGYILFSGIASKGHWFVFGQGLWFVHANWLIHLLLKEISFLLRKRTSMVHIAHSF